MDNQWHEEDQFRGDRYSTDLGYGMSEPVYYEEAYDPELREERARAVLGKSFLFMVLAMILSAMSALYVAQTPMLVYSLIMNSTLFYGLLILEVAIVFLANMAISRQNTSLSAFLFFAYSVVNGITLSVIVVAYAGTSLTSVFVLAGIVFGAMAFIGLTTKANLNSVGEVGYMLLIGVIALTVMNMFLKSSGLDLAITVVGLAVFIGLTIYDTKKIKEIGYEDTETSTTVLGIMGALTLYLDFINIFLKLLRLFGKRN